MGSLSGPRVRRRWTFFAIPSVGEGRLSSRLSLLLYRMLSCHSMNESLPVTTHARALTHSGMLTPPAITSTRCTRRKKWVKAARERKIVAGRASGFTARSCLPRRADPMPCRGSVPRLHPRPSIGTPPRPERALLQCRSACITTSPWARMRPATSTAVTVTRYVCFPLGGHGP